MPPIKYLVCVVHVCVCRLQDFMLLAEDEALVWRTCTGTNL